MFRSSIVAFPNQRPIIPHPCARCNLRQMKFSRNAEIRTASFFASLELGEPGGFAVSLDRFPTGAQLQKFLKNLFSDSPGSLRCSALIALRLGNAFLQR